MESRQIQDGMELYYAPEEREAADTVEAAWRRSITVIQDTWGFLPPKCCRMYVTDSWIGFLFHSAPWYVRVWLIATFPLWVLRLRKQWKRAAGWTMRYRHCPAICVKPPRLIVQSDRTIGKTIFVCEPDVDRKIAHVVCHELTHVFSASLKLPSWLNEGIAMVAVDRFTGQQTVKGESILSLNDHHYKRSPHAYWDLAGMKQQDVAYFYIRGYWITRFLVDTHPGLLKDLLKINLRPRFMEQRIASSLGMSRRAFWREIDNIVEEHFGHNSGMADK